MNDVDSSSCSWADCARVTYCRSLCGWHYRDALKSGKLERRYVKRGTKPKVCTFSDCGLPNHSRGLCSGHSSQAFKGKPLKAIRHRIPSTTRDERGRKHCSKCRKWYPESDFYKYSAGKDGLAGFCKDCASICSKENHQKNRYAYAPRRHNVSKEWYESARAAGCDICGKVSERMHVDHDHDCCPGGTSCGKCVRGLLCNLCNTGIGTLGDDFDRVIRAAEYLASGVRVGAKNDQ